MQYRMSRSRSRAFWPTGEPGLGNGLARAVDQSLGQVVLAARDDVHHGGVHLLARLSATVTTNGKFTRRKAPLSLTAISTTWSSITDRRRRKRAARTSIPSAFLHLRPWVISPRAFPRPLPRCQLRAIRSGRRAKRCRQYGQVRGTTITATKVDGVVGVAISLPQGESVECVLVRLDPEIELWYAPAMLSQPGEAGARLTTRLWGSKWSRLTSRLAGLAHGAVVLTQPPLSSSRWRRYTPGASRK